MSILPIFPFTSIVSLCILSMTLVTSGFPQPPLPLSSEDSNETKATKDDWDVLFPSISLRDWSIQMMTAPSLGATANKAKLMTEAWLFAPERPEARYCKCIADNVEQAWPAEWLSLGPGMAKRNMVVADDAAFREKSKLLTSMERQKWLNSYMQKLLVVNSS
ncbi:tuberoinfundibular peptide of 39 residues [Betta splendens]|uniref:Tuberoinfundibular peptide of 39 residues n=1 Tax=Betta splendens TaxID=158456 RepID=A0A6P7LP52_BETSP|nr:tuberoinfundibular peptide of 39 residues [Betta splendens]